VSGISNWRPDNWALNPREDWVEDKPIEQASMRHARMVVQKHHTTLQCRTEPCSTAWAH